MQGLHRKDLTHPGLSYRIIGCAFDVYNEVGGGHPERVYQRALGMAFDNAGLVSQQQAYYSLKYKDKIVGKNYLDFVVNKAVVVEIKKGDRFSRNHINQVLQYLKVTKMKLAVLINFGTDGVKFKRIINFDS